MLTECDATDIAGMANWPDEPERLLQALIKCRWIDAQGWHLCPARLETTSGLGGRFGSRSEIARRNAMARWHPQERQAAGISGIGRMEAAMRSGCPSAPYPSPYPSPSPLPSPSLRKSKDLLHLYRAEFFEDIHRWTWMSSLRSAATTGSRRTAGQ